MVKALWKGLLVGAIFVGSTQPNTSSAAEPKSPRDAEIAALIADLGDEQFTRRELATERLVLAGPAALKPLLAAACNENREIAWRATSALQQLSSKVQASELPNILSGIEKIDTSKYPHLAAVVADLQTLERQRRRGDALLKLRSLGGLTEEPSASELSQANSAQRAASHTTIHATSSPNEAILDAVAEPIRHEDVAPVLAGPEELQIVGLPAVDIGAPPIQRLLVDRSGTAAVPDATDEALDVANEPTPPPDFLPETAPGEIPAVQGEISDAYVGIVDVGGVGPVDPRNLAENPVPRVWLTRDWRGGDQGLELLKEFPELGELSLVEADVTDAGLKHIAAMPNISYLKLRGTRITSAGLQALRVQKPTLTILAVGRAMLGLSAAGDGDRCHVAAVNPASAAEAAGLRAGDTITQIGNTKVMSYVDLMIATFDRAPGDKLEVRYEREGERRLTVVELKARIEPPTLSR